MNYKKHLRVGPGGMDCPCCFDAPGSKSRALAIRTAKKTERRNAMREALEELEDLDEHHADELIFIEHD